MLVTVKRLIGPLLLIFLFGITACSSGGDEALPDSNANPDPNPNPTSELTIEEKLQAIIDEKVGTDADKLVGVSVSIRIGDQEHLSLTGGISKLGVPVTEDMRFGVGSITKTVVAATVMKLEAAGLRFDAPAIIARTSKQLRKRQRTVIPKVELMTMKEMGVALKREAAAASVGKQGLTRVGSS